MSVDMNFDATTVTPATGTPDPVPNGDYTLVITASEAKATKAGTGKILALTFEVVAPEAYKGRKIFANLNIMNPSAEAQKIAQGELSAICHATGVMQLRNSSQLHGIPFTAKVAIKQDAGYEPRNVIKKYSALSGATPIPQAAPAAAAPAANAPAWARKTA